jgi:hypothetical protein
MKYVTKQILEKYVELVDEAILIEEKEEFEEFCNNFEIDLGLCNFLECNDFRFRFIEVVGCAIIRENYIEKYKNLNPLLKSYWFDTVVYSNENLIELKKESLKARQQIVNDILTKHFKNYI